jgi:hypothetical protein
MRENGVNVVPSKMEYSQRNPPSITKVVLLKKMQDFDQGSKNTTL